MSRTIIGLACFLCSLAAHASLLMKPFNAATSRARLPPPSIVQLSVGPAARPEPPPEVARPPRLVQPPKPAPAPVAKPKPAPTLRDPVAPPEPAAEAAGEPEAEAAVEPATSDTPPPELTGTTLVSERGDAWSAPQGSGSARQGALRAGLPRAHNDRRPTTGQSSKTGASTALPLATTPLNELSQKPVPPPLARALERNYPLEARRQSKTGEAKVRVRIDPSGHVSLANVTFETADGFGKACQQTLLASTWTPPRGRNGSPTTTWVTYRCKFRIDD